MSETVNDYDDLLDEAGHRWRNRLIALVAVAALVAVGVYGLWAMVLGGGDSSAEEVQTAKVERGSIVNTLSTSGVVVAQSTADLSFGQSGVVSAMNVTLGQEVKQGDVLAEIESDDLESALTNAEVNLASAEVRLSQLLNGSSESEIASAEQSLVQAQANLDQDNRVLQDLLDGPSDSELLSAEQSVSSAQSQLEQALANRAKLDTTSEDAIAAAEEAVRKAENALENAKDTAANAANTLTSARASLFSAETAYCDDGSHGLSFCEERAAPMSSADRASLLKVTETGTPEEAAQASSVLASNTSYLNARASKLSANDAVESAEVDLEAARNDLEDAKKGPSIEEITSADAAIASAQAALDAANAKLAELNEGPTQSELETARSNVDTAAAALAAAKAKHDDVLDGPDPEDIELQRDQIQLAELSVERAREDLEKALIIAPFDGTVAALNIEVGQEVSGSGGEAAIILNTPDALRLDLAINEADLPNVEVGQAGFATFDAIEGGVFPFVIDSIGTNPTTTQGVVTYEARALILTERSPDAAGALPAGAAGDKASQRVGTPDAGAIPFEGGRPVANGADTDAQPLPGMNASLAIIVDQAQGVLTVPAQAIQTEGFESIVEVLKDDGSTEKVVVQTGVTDGTNTEITEGLEEGQTVIVPSGTPISAQPTSDTGFPQRGFGQGGVPGGGFPQQGGAQ